MQPGIAETLPIASLDWTSLVPQIGEANRSIARFDGILAHMPNPMLLGAPLTVLEAVLSSRIEGTVATLTEVLLHDAGNDPVESERRLDIEEIANYRGALKLAERELRTRPFTLNLLRKLHSTLMMSVRGQNKAPGEFRRIQNYIGRRGFGIEHATFIPPSPDRLMGGLDNWEKYYHSEDRDSLVQLALLHAQFEFLHPFLDGNGRLGRIIIPLFLYDKKILSKPAFYLSEYLEENRDEYLERLAALKYGGNAWNEWCLFFLQAVTQQADWNVHRLKALLRLHDKLRQKVRDLTTSRFALPMLEAMFPHPIFRASVLQLKAGMPQKPQFSKLIEVMIEANILKTLVSPSGSRSGIYSLHELVRLCESRPRK